FILQLSRNPSPFSFPAANNYSTRTLVNFFLDHSRPKLQGGRREYTRRIVICSNLRPNFLPQNALMLSSFLVYTHVIDPCHKRRLKR
ncbi:unnamed protein product, partial [Linum tenue]